VEIEVPFVCTRIWTNTNISCVWDIRKRFSNGFSFTMERNINMFVQLNWMSSVYSHQYVLLSSNYVWMSSQNKSFINILSFFALFCRSVLEPPLDIEITSMESGYWLSNYTKISLQPDQVDPSPHLKVWKREKSDKMEFSTFKWQTLLWCFSDQQLPAAKLFVHSFRKQMGKKFWNRCIFMHFTTIFQVVSPYGCRCIDFDMHVWYAFG